jgi:hypothetical protein
MLWLMGLTISAPLQRALLKTCYLWMLALMKLLSSIIGAYKLPFLGHRLIVRL